MSRTSVTSDRRAAADELEGTRTRARLNRAVFYGSAGGIVLVVILTMVAPELATHVIGLFSSWTIGYFGWFYVALAVGALIFLLYLGFSRYGHIRLGPKYSKPQYGTFTWAAMIFAAGINIDLMFFAVSGPVSHYLAPPTGGAETGEAAREASVWTIFHYGINGWAIYALMGLALAYFAYRRNLPLAVRSVLYPIIGKRAQGAVGHGVDIAAILGTIFGVAASLGIGVVQLNFGLQAVFGVPESLAVQMGILGFGLLVATVSAVSGVDKGIRWLSQLNVVLAALLAIFILFAGETLYLLNALVLNVGDYFTSLAGRSAETFAFNPQADWMGSWTLFFWAWWIAYAAFIGLFLARISRGRTIREFVLGVLILPFMYIVMWVSILGNAAIGHLRNGNTDFGEVAANIPEQGFYALLAEYPAFTIVALIATFTGLLFFVTTADSGALVMAQMSSDTTDPAQSSGTGLRIFWGVSMALLTAAMMIAGGITVMQSATIVIALPFSMVLVLTMIGLLRSLRAEVGPDQESDLRRLLGLGARTPAGRPSEVFPGDKSAEEYLQAVALPAISDLASEMRDWGFQAAVRSTLSADGPKTVELIIQPTAPQEPYFELRLCPRGLVGKSNGNNDLDLYVSGVRQPYGIQGMTYAQLLDHLFDEFARWCATTRTATHPGHLAATPLDNAEFPDGIPVNHGKPRPASLVGIEKSSGLSPRSGPGSI